MQPIAKAVRNYARDEGQKEVPGIGRSGREFDITWERRLGLARASQAAKGKKRNAHTAPEQCRNKAYQGHVRSSGCTGRFRGCGAAGKGSGKAAQGATDHCIAEAGHHEPQSQIRYRPPIGEYAQSAEVLESSSQPHSSRDYTNQYGDDETRYLPSPPGCSSRRADDGGRQLLGQCRSGQRNLKEKECQKDGERPLGCTPQCRFAHTPT